MPKLPFFVGINDRKLIRTLFLFFLHLFHSVGENESSVFQSYLDVEHEVFIFTKQMKGFVSFSSTICLFLPIIYAGMRLLVGKYTHNDWYLPYKFR